MGTRSSFDKAQANYEFAVNELMRPEEDVVLLSACHSVQGAIRGYLCGFLESNNISFSKEEDIESLMSRCILQDINFVRFDLSRLNCKCDRGDCPTKTYCLTLDQVKNCISLVSKLDDFVLPGNDVAQV